MDQLFLVTLAEGMNAVMTRTLKYTVKEIRPDGGPYSFPSGHTANAFLGAHMAYKEFKDSSPVLAYSDMPWPFLLRVPDYIITGIG